MPAHYSKLRPQKSLTINIFIGKTFAGKTTLVKQLNYYLHIPQTITNTTRPKRLHEKNGVDYHFVSLNKFKKDQQKGLTSCVRNVNNQYFYYLSLSQLFDDLKNSKTNMIDVILDAKGALELANKIQASYSTIKINQQDYPIKYHIYYIITSLFDRLKRYTNQDRQSENPQKVLKRFYTDEFQAFKSVESAKVQKKYHITKISSNFNSFAYHLMITNNS